MSQKRKNDIGEAKINESVYDFTKDLVDTLPYERRDDPYPANGWSNSVPQSVLRGKKHDVGEKGMDEEVHGFVSNDKNVPSINE